MIKRDCDAAFDKDIRESRDTDEEIRVCKDRFGVGELIEVVVKGEKSEQDQKEAELMSGRGEAFGGHPEITFGDGAPEHEDVIED